MRRIESVHLEIIRPFFEAAAAIAAQATCQRHHCGTVIVKDGIIIGSGFNGPPLNDENSRMCHEEWDTSLKPKYDLTCCVHAELRAIIHTCKEHGAKIEGSTLYFMRIDAEGNFTDAGVPYCTDCSRITMEAGVAEFALWNNHGADVYPTAEYNRLSFEYYRKGDQHGSQ